MKSKRIRNVMDLGMLSIGSGVMASAIQDVGGNPKGIQNLSSAYPAMGSIMGTGMVLDELYKLRKRRY